MCTGGQTSGALGLAGGLMDAAGQYEAGQASKQAAKFNARSLRFSAKQARAQGEFQAKQAREQGAAVAGEQRAALAAQGVDVGSGTALALQEQTARLSEEDAQQAKHNAALAAWGYKAQAAQVKLQGQYDARAATSRGISSLLGSLSEANDSGLFG